MKLQDFNSKYEYKCDIEKWGVIDTWNILEPNEDGKYLGDCEDYALTLKYRVEGFSDLALYYCKYDGTGHCLGKLGEQWIDNIQMKLVDKLPKQYTEIKKYNLFVVWSKLIVGKIMMVFK